MRTLTLLTVLLCLNLCGVVSAATVSQQSAQTIALNFYKVNAHSPTGNRNVPQVSATLSYTRQETDGTIDFYVFNIQPGPGFVIVSADDNFNPVLAYSTEFAFDPNLSKTGVVNWMANTAEKIYKGIQQNVKADAAIKNQWQSYANGINPVSSRSTGIGPLAATTWNQSPLYNLFCPTISSGQCVTGCVATAMAQIMKYWNFPPQGVGSYQYDDVQPNFSNDCGEQSANFGTTSYKWTEMPNAITGPSNDTAVATLMYQCGVSVAMDYGPESGAYVLQTDGGQGSPCAQNSYVLYFSYDASTMQGVHQSSYSTANWITLLENELNIGRIIEYVGTDPKNGGHTWVCDGYDASGNLHMNWGWGGADNGYYSVTDLNPSPYDFSVNDEALIGIQPNSPVQVTAMASSSLICPGGTTLLVANGPENATYQWSPTTGLDCSNCPSPNASPTTTTTYTVTVDSAGILARSFATVTVASQIAPQFSVSKLPGCTLPVTYSFANTSTNGTNYTWNFGDGTSSSSGSPTHAYSNANSYTVTLVATNGCFTDTLVQQDAVNVVDEAPIVPGRNICKGQSVTLNATGQGNIDWYNEASGGTAFQTGNTYTTPDINSNTTYYVSSSIIAPLNYVGPADNTFGTGSYFTNTNQHSVIFNCTVAQVLQTVEVYAGSAGNRTIGLIDSAGTVLQSVTVDIPKGDQTITLNLSVPVGNNMKLAISGTVDLYRDNENAAYPYFSADSTVILTNSDAGIPGYYYYFYNWVLQQPTCVTNRTAVQVGVNSLSSSVQASYSNGDSTVTFTPVNTSATSFLWNFDVDNATSTSESPTYTFPTKGNYDVVLVESNGSCTDTISYTVSVGGTATGITENNLISEWTLFPDPTKDVVNLRIQSGQDVQTCKLSVYNMLGERLLSQSISLNSGANSLKLNVSQLSPAVYIIAIESEDYISTKRFSKVE